MNINALKVYYIIEKDYAIIVIVYVFSDLGNAVQNSDVTH